MLQFNSLPADCMDALQTALSWSLQSSVLQAKTVTMSLSLFFLKLNTDTQLGLLCKLYLLDLLLGSLLSTGLSLASLSPLTSFHLCLHLLVVRFNAFIIMKCLNVENRIIPSLLKTLVYTHV